MKLVLSTIGTIGDVIPFVRLAQELVRRGHEVTAYSWQQFASWFAPPVRFVAVDGGVGEDELHATLDEALRAPGFVEQKRVFARMFYGLGDGPHRVEAGYRRAREVFVGHDFAVVNVLDHVGQLAAIDAGVPWASYASRPPPPLVSADPLNAPLDDALSELLATITGVQRRVRMFREWSPLLAFAACAPELLPDSLRHVIEATGAWLAPIATTTALPLELETFLAGGDCVFATFGTMPDVFGRTAALLEAARTTRARTIIQILPPHVVPPAIPDNVFVLRERVAFDALVPRVASVIHHGSVGTTHEVLRAGKPSLILPHMGDQFFWAQVLQTLGLGPAPVRHTEISSAAIAVGMSALAAPAFGAAASAFSSVIAARDGVSRSVDLIEARSSAAT
jgi:sterol 3beta-glucosyltransferase